MPSLRETEGAKECLQVGMTLSSQLQCHTGSGAFEDTGLRINLFPGVVMILPCDIKWTHLDRQP